MQYDFDKMIDRRNTNSLKWRGRENELPMWVADMDFEAAPEILSALKKRLDHGVFGYVEIPGEWQQAYMTWWEQRHHVTMEKDWLVYASGVIPTLSSTVRKITTPGENVVFLSPVYNIFYNSVVNNGRNVLECPLKYEPENRTYSIDFDALERNLADPQTSLMIFCNPHNPIGKIWRSEELERVGELCLKYQVTILVDEIHCDLTDPDKEYVPFLSLPARFLQNAIIAVAPTKAFNLAGLQTAAAVIPEEHLRHKIWRQLNTDEVGEPNAFAIEGTIAAFLHGGDWLDELREYLYENKKIVVEFLEERIPEIGYVPSEATYLLWLDCSQLGMDSKRLSARIRKETGLFLSMGSIYGTGGEQFLRMNIACPKERLKDGLNRLEQAVRLLK